MQLSDVQQTHMEFECFWYGKLATIQRCSWLNRLLITIDYLLKGFLSRKSINDMFDMAQNCHAPIHSVTGCHQGGFVSVFYFTKEVNPRLIKRSLKTNGRLANLELTSLVKKASGVMEKTSFKLWMHSWLEKRKMSLRRAVVYSYL